MSIDQEKISTRCKEINESCNRLEEIAGLPKKTFLNDQDTKDIASYRLLIAIEAALSICYHFCSNKLNKVPDNYANCFQMLEEEKIISVDLSEKLQKMSRFRNLLVHVYWNIDDEQLYLILNEHLDDIRKFSRVILKSI